MNLVIDIGNSRVKWALAQAGRIEAAYASDRTSAWLDRLPIAEADAIWLASVGAPQAAEDVTARAAASGIVCNRLTASARFEDLVNGYPEPARLGIDRWMACIGAVQRCSGSIMVVDAGTALTLDWIDAEHHHHGGLITPGITTMRRRLAESTQLSAPDRQSAGDVLGISPSGAIERGTFYSAVCLVNDMVRRYPADHCLLTGGEAGSIQSHLTGAWQHIPNLVLEGLATYAWRGSRDLPGANATGQNI